MPPLYANTVHSLPWHLVHGGIHLTPHWNKQQSGETTISIQGIPNARCCRIGFD